MPWFTDHPIAHRGLHQADDPPENSLAAFEAAANAGFPIELDVRRLRDGTVVVFHDRELERITGRQGRVEDLDRAALSQLRICGTDERIPTFDEVLDHVAGRVPILVEIKSQPGRIAGLDAATWAALEGYRGEFAIQSFDPITVNWYQRHSPQTPRGFLACRDYPASVHPLAAWAFGNLLPLPLLRPQFVGYDSSALGTIRAQRRLLQVPLLVWTVRTVEERRALPDDVANVIFEGFDPRL